MRAVLGGVIDRLDQDDARRKLPRLIIPRHADAAERTRAPSHLDQAIAAAADVRA